MQRQEGKTSIDTHLSTRSHAGTEQEAHPKGYSAPVMADRVLRPTKPHAAVSWCGCRSCKAVVCGRSLDLMPDDRPAAALSTRDELMICRIQREKQESISCVVQTQIDSPCQTQIDRPSCKASPASILLAPRPPRLSSHGRWGSALSAPSSPRAPEPEP